MNALLTFAILGATVFVEQDVPGLEVGSARFPFATVSCNAYTTDVNRDGQPDLILPHFVRLQIAGRFPDSGRIRSPENGDFAATHINGDLFYGYRDGRVACYRLFDNAWTLFWEESLESEYSVDATPIFQDVDADGQTEMLLAGDTTLRVFRLARGAAPAGTLDVYPPRRPQLDPVHDLWRPYAGNGTATSMSRRFRLAFSETALTAHEFLGGSPNTYDHRVTEFRIESPLDGDLRAVEQRRESVPEIPAFLSPCQLNADALIDYAGVRDAAGPVMPWSPPITDIVVAITGRDRQTIRTKAPKSGISVADFDADGDADILVESNNYLDGPPREAMLSAASQRRFIHRVSVHVQELGGAYSKTPRDLLSIAMRFDKPLSIGGPRWDAYLSGGLTSTQGDFNGDKRVDLAICDAPARISIYINHEGLFHREADLSVTVPPGYARFVATAVDDDGKSDIVLLAAHGSNAPPRVLFSR